MVNAISVTHYANGDVAGFTTVPLKPLWDQ